MSPHTAARQEPLHRLPVRLLGDLVSPRALERILADAARARGQTPETLGPSDLEDILKREVFKRLQLSVPAALAKRRVSEVIGALLEAAPSAPAAAPGEDLSLLEEGARRFALYFDWPETQRLRGILGVARQQQAVGADLGPLLREGQDLIALMERRLEEGLVAQAQDLAELRAAFGRVQGMGGKEVRRLESLMAQVEEAQKGGVLQPAEVERARSIAFTLRRQLESSVMQPLPGEGGDPAPVDPAVQARVLALEQEHAARQLADLARDSEALRRARPELEARLQALRGEAAAGTLSAETLDAWRRELEQVREAELARQRSDLAELEGALAALPPSPALEEARVALGVARLTLDGGGLATDELRDLHATLDALQAAPEGAAQRLEVQRDLADLERAARDVPGAADDLAPGLTAAREALKRGETPDVSALWTALERRMAQAAQQREDFDARADRVIREYDTVRHLAGETTQKLGRLADTLRAQRRLGRMSALARERYAQTLTDAEALLAEARAEYEAAQQVTASFGADALSGLLDVFDLGGEAEEAAPAPEPAPAASPETAELPYDTWRVRGGQLVAGPVDAAAQGVAALLAQADDLGGQTLRFTDDRAAWAARLEGAGVWRLARGPNAGAIDDRVGAWLEGRG
ncbi:hypothetical protein RDMS_00170 [Deinococcus sp. RL]|uniref:hypothetical protein n=1 Tax=Deinococcus sp. RL TaxID=1489678 RepID=UPI0004D49E5E|nr:hypothetical protein [Deinococcus sp. RL]KEF35764.1 hypothetical protein RDMS_00170 [Deinococcus sp. RL]